MFAPNGTLLPVGSISTRPTYADTLEAVAEHGPDAFYNGKIAQDIVKTVRERGGVMSLEDLASSSINLFIYLSLIGETVRFFD